MPFEIPEELPERLLPLAWMVGRWDGVGTVEHPSMPVHRFHQILEITNNGQDYLAYQSRTWVLDDASRDGAPDACESGYLRVVPSREEAPRVVEVEMLLAHPTGVIEVYVGHGGEGKLELATDVVARTATGPDYTAAKRLFGYVRGDFMWAYDMVAFGHPMATYASAHLRKAS